MPWVSRASAGRVTTRNLLLVLASLNLVVLAGVFLRRLLKQELFALRDAYRLRCAAMVEESLQQGKPSTRKLPLPTGWHREAAEEVLLARWGMGTPPQRQVLAALFEQWGLLAWRRARLRHWGASEPARSALILARLGRTEALPELLRLLEVAPRNTRVAIVNAIEMMGEPAAVDALISFYAKRGINHVRPVLSALIRCASQHPVRLRPHLKHPEAHVRRIVAAALAEVATEDETDCLLLAASDPDPEVRAKAARALGRTNNPQALDSLKALGRDPTWYVRLQAVGGLASSRQPGTAEPIWEAARDRHWRVRQRAVAALCESSSDPAGLLKRMREEVKDRYALAALLSLYERKGTVWNAIGQLHAPQPELRETSQGLIREMLRSGALSSVLYALEAHPDPDVRREIVRLIAECSPSLAGLPLANLLASSHLDQQTRQEVQALLTRLGEGS